MVSSMRTTKFCYLSLIYIDLPNRFKSFTFCSNGGRCQHDWRPPIVWDPPYFSYVFLPILKIIFVELEWLKILKDPLEEDSPIVASSHILFTYSDFLFFYIYLFWKFHVFSWNGWKLWILKDLIEGPLFWCLKLNLSFLDINLSWKFDVSSLNN